VQADAVVIFVTFFAACLLAQSTNHVLFVREHGVHAGPKDYFVVVVVVIRGSI
jgi:hypothetical protein